MQKLPTNIVWRGRTAYVRVKVPADLVEAFGRTFVRESLDTTDVQEAKLRGATRLAALHQQWDGLRKRSGLSQDDLKRIASQFYDERLEADFKRRAGLADRPGIGSAESDVARSKRLRGRGA